jgi:NADPH-dependent 2,4-dienoyl-CoA reductase/sulfur reductase-like enzyme
MTSRSEPNSPVTEPGAHDVAVVGGGPAGLAAAVAAVEAGARVVLLDAGTRPGGQYWRHPVRAGAASPEGSRPLTDDEVAHLHHGLPQFRRLEEALEAAVSAGRAVVRAEHQVWTVGRTTAGVLEVRAVAGRGAAAREHVVRARSLVLAPGAYDRQIPFPGWDLPGVFTAGGAQALLKGQGVVAGRRFLVAGTGPFLLSVAAGLASSGARVVGVHEAASARGWLPRAGTVVRNVGKLGEGAGYAATLLRHRVPYRARSTVVAAHGETELTSVTVARLDASGQVRPGTERVVEVDALAVGWGFTPQLELPLALGVQTRVDVDGSLVVTVDEEQRTSVDGVFVAGEACGVGGAALAVVEGEIAGAAAARTAGRAARRPTASLRRQRAGLRAFAEAMHRVYPVPSGWTARAGEDTVVCRCEEVSVGRLRESADDGAQDARSAKLLTRVGMGWCQGRVCGYASACLLAEASGTPYAPGSVGTRPVAVPVRLGALAGEPLEADVQTRTM